MSQEPQRQTPVRRVKVAQVYTSEEPRWQEREDSPGVPSRSSGRDLQPYLIGGVVSAVVILMLVVVWILAVPDNPFTGTNNAQPPQVQGVNNNVNPYDVPTVPVPVGVGTSVIPASVPSVPAGVPTGSPGPAGDLYLPHSLGISLSGGIPGHGAEVSSYLAGHLVAAGE